MDDVKIFVHRDSYLSSAFSEFGDIVGMRIKNGRNMCLTEADSGEVNLEECDDSDYNQFWTWTKYKPNAFWMDRVTK
ncbi:ricin-type beta-trefoil lectin domain protein [Gregarina niphandrodes]|uniref:Ricin-type beta-trefoil lectin domain protein n=1 Tax=Gregarina niphandrodes TaxID=110365 RepID=A0A023B1G8_GRENI|nr:ricin-type beta-trefoil lectin domain protein [Gregarina niphandrodes]EZG46941.1 ricin-type beta-trefoil lectin domain protein [Gregarina niphandrodes]|eukprot:XP_011132216.1 ricin-type beta-trefoil lectin domain protein [Gregarina niphandrodes]